MPRIAAFLALAACVADPDADATPPEAPRYWLIDTFAFLTATDAGLEGFDVDGVTDDCGKPDATAPDGTSSVDNQFGQAFAALPSGATTVLPDALSEALRNGGFLTLLELGGGDLSVDGPTSLTLREGAGTPIVGGHGRMLPSQTLDLADDPLMGHTDDAVVQDGVLEAGPFAFSFRMDFLGTPIDFGVQRGVFRLEQDGERLLGMAGGVIPLATALALVENLGGCDEPLRDTLRALVPLLVDARTDPAGTCDAISGAFALTAVPAFVWEDVDAF